MGTYGNLQGRDTSKQKARGTEHNARLSVDTVSVSMSTVHCPLCLVVNDIEAWDVICELLLRRQCTSRVTHTAYAVLARFRP